MAPIIRNILRVQKEGTQICMSKTKSLKVPTKGAPSPMFPQQGPCGERCSVSRANGLFIHLYLLESPKRSPPRKCREKIQSQSTEPHADRRPTYNGVWHGSPRKQYLSVFKFCKDMNLICIGVPKYSTL